MIRFLAPGIVIASFVAIFGGPPVYAQSISGAYLAGRYAVSQNDFEQASQYYMRALAYDPDDRNLMERSVINTIAAGEFQRALPIVKVMFEQDKTDQIANLILQADMAKREDFAAILKNITANEGERSIFDQLSFAWAQLGLGQADGAFQAFENVVKQQGYSGFGKYHMAMAKAVVGDFESASELLADEGENGENITRRGAIARVQILSQLGQNDVALSYLHRIFGEILDPELDLMRQALGKDEPLKFTLVNSARDGLAEIYSSFAQAVFTEAGAEYALLYGRMAQMIRPRHTVVLLLNAEILEQLGQHELAIQSYKQVPPEHPSSYGAEIGRAKALRNSAQETAAIEVLEQLARRFPTQAVIFSTLGDIQREQEHFEQAIRSYDQALEQLQKDNISNWFVLYARAISYERLGQWEQAEADFRAALELSPEQPQVLNYLGYSLVEKRTNLDEALDMIERAVQAEPESAYIVDSLAWVKFRLGRYDEALEPMERAVELMPVDPILNDHLGDVYWAVGRHREARFQWSRALSFHDPAKSDDELNPDRIRRKLEIGLDAVVAEEGGAPLKVAHDN